MGDKSQIPIYAPLFNYLEQNGVDLSASGSAERGLSLGRALEFLEMLESRDVRVLGIEPWRKEGSAHRCDASGVWEFSSDADTIEQVRQYLYRLELQAHDLVTVQYS